jgi:hypothetical protein
MVWVGIESRNLKTDKLYLYPRLVRAVTILKECVNSGSSISPRIVSGITGGPA